jgi:hypothetical protein
VREIIESGAQSTFRGAAVHCDDGAVRTAGTRIYRAPLNSSTGKLAWSHLRDTPRARGVPKRAKAPTGGPGHGAQLSDAARRPQPNCGESPSAPQAGRCAHRRADHDARAAPRTRCAEVKGVNRQRAEDSRQVARTSRTRRLLATNRQTATRDGRTSAPY